MGDNHGDHGDVPDDDTLNAADEQLMEALQQADESEALDPALLAAHPDESGVTEIQPKAVIPPGQRPDLPIYDEHAMPVVYFNCWKCKRRDYMAEDTYELYRIRGHRPFCLVCQSPDRYKWRVDEQGREYLQPLAAAINRGLRPGEREAQRLELLSAERTDKELRRVLLEEIIERSQRELGAVEARLAELSMEIPEAQDAFEKAQHDPNRGDQIKAEALLAELARETARLTVMRNNDRYKQERA